MDDIVFGFISGNYTMDQMYTLVYDLKDLAYRNTQECNFLGLAFALTYYMKTEASVDAIAGNIQNNAYKAIALITPVIQLLQNYNEITTYSQIYAAADLIGFNFGSVTQLFLGFH